MKLQAKWYLRAVVVCVVALPAVNSIALSDGTTELGIVFGKHDGRRGSNNPYPGRIDAKVKEVVRTTGDSSSVLSARFALMGEPLEEDEPPPVPTPPTTPAPISSSGSSTSGTAPTAGGERATRFDQ